MGANMPYQPYSGRKLIRGKRTGEKIYKLLHKECPNCKMKFYTRNPYKMYCSERCNKEASNQRRKK